MSDAPDAAAPDFTPPELLAEARARVEARLAAAESAIAAGADIDLVDLEDDVRELCIASACVETASRDQARTALEALLTRIGALEQAVARRGAP